jgi:YVTN family beta-propeller protein
MVEGSYWGFARRALVVTALCAVATAASTGTAPTIGNQPGGGVLVPSNQLITPVGRIVRLEDERPKDLAVSPDGKLVAVLAQSRLSLFNPESVRIAELPLKAGPLGVAWMPDSRSLFVSGDKGQIYRIQLVGSSWKIVHSFLIADVSVPPSVESAPVDASKLEWRPTSREHPHLAPTKAPSKHYGNPQVTGLAVSPKGDRLYVALGIRSLVAVVDVSTEKVLANVPVGVAPYRITLSGNGDTLFVANRGGRAAQPNEPQDFSAGVEIRIDPATGAALRGSVSVIDTKTYATSELEVGRQPSGLALSPDGRTLYVANSDDDTLAVIDVGMREIRRSVSLRPAQDLGFGQLPTDVALAEDGKSVYVACGGANTVAVFSLPEFAIRGYLPTDWFPIALAERGGQLFVANAKGIGARLPTKNGAFRAYGSVGTVQFISPEARRDLSALTRRVAAGNHWNMADQAPRPEKKPVPVPERVGEPSFFKHVVYIIKENHTYDEDLGDMPEGNGAKSLCIFGEDVTPNEHALARQFTLLDNTYASGSNSADGHQWTDSAIANAYIEQNFDDYVRSYPFNGGDPLACSPAGFLWNAAAQAGKTVRVHGEFANIPRVIGPIPGERPTWSELWQDYKTHGHKYQISAGTDNAALRPFLDPGYVGFPLTVSDQWRADQFISELKTDESTGSFPTLSILLLPSNHTAGTTPGYPTPRALIADNDLALGRIVEALTHSRFWPETLILVIEDDTRFGLDHVDGHRTLAFCVSPYTRRGVVVNECYNHTSFVRTIGLILGLPAMNRFDRTATPLTACFAEEADLHSFTHVPNRVALDEMNPPLVGLRGKARHLAAECARVNWSKPDQGDTKIVARAAWNTQRPHGHFPWKYFNPGNDSD